jgi:hypothetical protein
MPARAALSLGRTPGPKPQSTGAGLSSSLIVGAAASSDALALIAKIIPTTARYDLQRFHCIVPLHTHEPDPDGFRNRSTSEMRREYDAMRLDRLSKSPQL